MKRIILDTNFLLIPSQFKVHIFEEIKRICHFKYKLVIIKETLDELKKIKKSGKQRHKMAASIALSLIQSHGIETVSLGTGNYADDILVKYAKPKTDIIATQDLALKRKLKARRIPLITLRQKKYLILQ